MAKRAKKAGSGRSRKTPARKASRASAKKTSATTTARRKAGSAAAKRRQSGDRKSKAGKTGARRWSQQVTAHSDALDLEEGVFNKDSPRQVASSLKRSAEHSGRRKADPFRSALSMLTFYINRAGSGLSARRRGILEKAKDELRRQFGRA